MVFQVKGKEPVPFLKEKVKQVPSSQGGESGEGDEEEEKYVNLHIRKNSIAKERRYVNGKSQQRTTKRKNVGEEEK